MQAMTESGHTARGDLQAEPPRPQMPAAALRELAMEAGFVGVVILALVLLVVASAGH